MKLGKFAIKPVYVFLFFFVLLSFIVSLVFYNLNSQGVRRVFYFESLDNPGLFMEVRYLSPYSEDQSQEDDIRQFVKELVLGPVTNRFKAVFAPGTTIDTCFLRDDVLYVDLSSTALQPAEGTTSIKTGVEIFEKNIRKNFPDIQQVCLFINNQQAYENENEINL